MRSRPWLLLLLLILPGLVGFDFVADVPENQGLSSSGLDALESFSEQLASPSGLLVMRNDRVVLEAYAGASASERFQIMSATKSFGASLLAVALDDGVVALDAPACGRPDMTLHQLASFTAGLPKSSNAACDASLLFPPGQDFAYSDGSANRARDEIMAGYGIGTTGLKPLFEQRVMHPIGAFAWSWDRRFSSGLQITLRDMARYGRLWLRGGDWDGTRLISAASVVAATTAANPALKKDYGYLWWVNSEGPAEAYDRYGSVLNPVFPPDAPRDAFLAIGCTRSFVLVVPSLQLVAVRGGEGCISISNGTPQLTDESRAFVEHVLAAVLKPACDDGIDNDGDGRIDAGDDPGCWGPADDLEDPACDDGLDNDGDGFTDLQDRDCAAAWMVRESWRRCGLGFELPLLLTPLWLARRRRRRASIRARRV